MRSSELPIYRVTYELFHEVTRLARNFPRDLKIALSGKLQSECTDLVLAVYRANCSRGEQRRKYIASILESVQVVELLLRLCKDMKLLSIKQHSRCVELTDQIGRQANGWKNAT